MEPAMEFARFTSRMDFNKIPQKTVDTVLKDILDYFGNSLAGSNDKIVETVYNVISSFGGVEQSTVLTYKMKLPGVHAALINGAMGTASDFEDTHEGANTHLGSACIPAALAAAEINGNVGGSEFVVALTAAMEIGARIGMFCGRLKPHHIMGGWDFAALHGSFTATIAAGRLLHLSETELLNALGLAYHQISGNALPGIEGADTKVLGAGFAARNGLIAAIMAKNGLTGAHGIFGNNDFGLSAMYHGGANVSEMTAKLGETFHVDDLGFKPYPCCLMGHRHIDAVLELMHSSDIQEQDIVKIIVYVCTPVSVQLCEPREEKICPKNRMVAQFSLPWMLSCAVVRGKIGFSEFTQESLYDSELMKMANRVETIVDQKLKNERESAKIVVRTTNESFETQTKDFYGSPGNPMDWIALENKFRENAKQCRKSLTSEKVERGIVLIKKLPDIPNIGAITEVFS